MPTLRQGLPGLGLAACLLATAAPSAHAALAGAPPIRTVDRPDLASVTVAGSRAEYCFTDTIDGIDNVTGFQLKGYAASDSVDSVNAAVEFGKFNCVLADFPGGTDVSKDTVGTVKAGAVHGQLPTGKGNLNDSTGLTGTTQGTGLGDTTGANIVSVIQDPTHNDLDVTYDRKIASLVPTSFVYDDQAGNAVGSDAASIDSGSATIVHVHFPATLDQGVRDAVRFAGLANAVTDKANHKSIVESHSVTSWNGAAIAPETARPDLTAAKANVPNAIDFTFDEPVQLGDVTKFGLYSSTQGLKPGLEATVLNTNNHVVRVWFGSNSGGVVLADAGAIRSDDSAALDNSIGTLPFGSIPGPSGFTSAPDATGATFDKDAGTVTITFDSSVSGVPDPANFVVYDPFGNVKGSAQSVLAVSGKTVTLLFGEDVVENAIAVGLAPGAVASGSPAQIVARAPGAAPGTTSAAPAGAADTGAPRTPLTTPAGGVEGASPAAAATKPAATARLASIRRVGRTLRVKVVSTARSARLRVRVLRGHEVVRTATLAVATNRSVTLRSVRVTRGERVTATVVR